MPVAPTSNRPSTVAGEIVTVELGFATFITLRLRDQTVASSVNK